MNEHIKLLETSDPWEIIVRITRNNKIEDKSLKINRDRTCPICFYPIKLNEKCSHHPGLINVVEQFEMTIGHFYKLDYNGKPLNWFTQELKKISTYPYRYSHELFRQILTYRITKSGWDLDDILFSTMVPTTNHQMRDLFRELAISLRIQWINPEVLFNSKRPTNFYKNRRDYVRDKYEISKYALDSLNKIEKRGKSVLLFDDVLYTGFTIGRIIELLCKLQSFQFKVVIIGRTIKRGLIETAYFPLKRP